MMANRETFCCDVFLDCSPYPLLQELVYGATEMPAPGKSLRRVSVGRRDVKLRMFRTSLVGLSTS